MNELKALRITHRTADVSVRGKFSMAKAERSDFYLRLKDVLGIRTALIVSTCNRFEIYYSSPEDLGEQILRLLCAAKGRTFREVEKFFECINDHHEVLQLLYRVAVGLDSQVLGDQQIFGQVKEAYQEAADLEFADTLLHRVMHSVFYAHKLVCQQTQFKSGAASVAYTATKLLQDQGKRQRILVIGAGQTGADICRHLVKKGFENITVTNRTAERSAVLAEELGIGRLNFDKLFDKPGDYDTLIGAVDSRRTLFDRSYDHMAGVQFTIIDLCSPQIFSEAFVAAHGKAFFNLDSVSHLTAQTIDARSQEIPAVENILADCLLELHSREEEFQQTVHLKQFKATLETLRNETLKAYFKKADESKHALMTDLSKSIINKIVKLPALQLKQPCQRHRSEELGTTLNQLFNPEFLTKQIRS